MFIGNALQTKQHFLQEVLT